MCLVWSLGTTLMQDTAVDKTIEMSLAMQFFLKEGWAYLCVYDVIPQSLVFSNDFEHFICSHHLIVSSL